MLHLKVKKRYKKNIRKNDKIKIKKENNQPTKIKTSGSTFKNPIKTTKKAMGIN